MPLYKKKELDLLPVPELLPDQMVWFLNKSGEIFTSYEKYIERLYFLNSKVFSCSRTGFKNLTYQEAVQSEHREEELLRSSFPRVWAEPFARIIHYNALPLIKLVEQLYSYFLRTFFTGEKVYIRPDGAEKVVCVVKTRHSYSKVYELMGNVSSKELIPLMNDSKEGYFYELIPVKTTKDRSIVYISHESMIKREKTELHKKNFRKIIKAMARKDIWVGAPWILRSHIIKRYKLYNLPVRQDAELILKRREMMRTRVSKRNRKKSAKNDDGVGARLENNINDESVGKSKPQNPNSLHHSNSTDSEGAGSFKKRKTSNEDIVDQSLSNHNTLKTNAKLSNTMVIRPDPSCKLGNIPQSYIGPLLESWVFMVSFNKLMCTVPIVFDQFVDAISQDHGQGIPPYVSQSFCSLLSLACEESAKIIPSIRRQLRLPNSDTKKSSSLNSYEKYFVDDNGTIFHKSPYGIQKKVEESGLIEIRDAYLNEFDKYPDEVAELLKQYLSNYEKLNEGEKNVLNNWYDWGVARKAINTSTGCTKKSSKNKKAKTTFRKANNVGWQLALVGFVRDCVTVRQWPGKWKFVNGAISPVAVELDKDDKELISESFANTSKDSKNNTDINHYGYRLRRNTTQTDNMSISSLSRAVGFGLRERQRNITYRPIYERYSKNRKGVGAFIGLNKQRRWTRDASVIIKNSRKMLSEIPVTNRIFLIHFLIGSVVRGKRFSEFMDAHREKRKTLLSKKRSVGMDRKTIASIKSSLIEKCLKLENEKSREETQYRSQYFNLKTLENQNKDSFINNEESSEDFPRHYDTSKYQESLLTGGGHDHTKNMILRKRGLNSNDQSSSESSAKYNHLKNEMPSEDYSRNHGVPKEKEELLTEERYDLTKNRLRSRRQNSNNLVTPINPNKLKVNTSRDLNTLENDNLDLENLNSPTSCLEMIKSLEKKEELLKSREESLGKLLAKTASIKCCTMLGRDKYFNRYWWFDEQLGCQASTASESDYQPPYDQPPEPNTDLWLCGYLFVEIIQKSWNQQLSVGNNPHHFCTGVYDSHNAPNQEIVNGKLSHSFPGTSSVYEIPGDSVSVTNHTSLNSSIYHNTEIDNLDDPNSNTTYKYPCKDNMIRDTPRLSPGSWGFYTDASQVELLLRWLSPDCSTEAHLLKELKKLKDSIIFRMGKRREYIDSSNRYLNELERKKS